MRQRWSAQMGIAAPLGFLGIGWAYAPLRWLYADAGVGWGATGLQIALTPMVALGSNTSRFIAGAGIGWAAIPQGCSGDPMIDSSGKVIEDDRPCLWLNVNALGYEHIGKNGSSTFIAAGVAMPFRDVSVPGISIAHGGGGSFDLPAYNLTPQVHVGLSRWQ